jgi:flagellar P-ring protein precursor FlgI
MKRMVLTVAVCFLFNCVGAASADAGGVRIKDITDLDGARSNQLNGYGLVTGLDGTGSKSLVTQSTAVQFLKKKQVFAKTFQDLPSDPIIRSGNISIVAVTAEIGPYSRKGSSIDVTVSALDDAKSLNGGTLLFTTLEGADGEVYATAQGGISTGGFLVSGAAASVQKNHPTVGRIPNGAKVEKEALGEICRHGCIRLLIRQPDYSTAQQISKVINDMFPYMAFAIDAGAVTIMVPKNRVGNVVGFASEIQSLEVSPDAPARVVINERTGTIVAGAQVKLSMVAITNGSLSIVKTEEPQVSQPNPLTNAPAVVVPRSKVGVTEQSGILRVVGPTITVGELSKALNALGVTPRDLISIFQAIDRAGALHAELIIM